MFTSTSPETPRSSRPAPSRAARKRLGLCGSRRNLSRPSREPRHKASEKKGALASEGSTSRLFRRCRHVRCPFAEPNEPHRSTSKSPATIAASAAVRQTTNPSGLSGNCPIPHRDPDLRQSANQAAPRQNLPRPGTAGHSRKAAPAYPPPRACLLSVTPTCEWRFPKPRKI
jgi:hypothetical protein